MAGTDGCCLVQRKSCTQKDLEIAGMAVDAFACLGEIATVDDSSRQHLMAAATMLLDIINITIGRNHDLQIVPELH